MSATFDLTTVTNSIAALSITGVTVKDSDEITDSLGMSGTALLVPRPDNFLTGLSIVRGELSGQNLTVRYTLNYQYFHCVIGGGLGGIFSVYQGMLTNIGKIIVAFSNDATLTGAIDNGYPNFGRLGPIQDASGNKYHGCEVSIPITQFLEV